jgi:hypothetical protein
VKDEKGDVLCRLNLHRVSDVRQIEVLAAGPLVPDPGPFGVEIAVANLKSINR